MGIVTISLHKKVEIWVERAYLGTVKQQEIRMLLALLIPAIFLGIALLAWPWEKD